MFTTTVNKVVLQNNRSHLIVVDALRPFAGRVHMSTDDKGVVTVGDDPDTAVRIWPVWVGEGFPADVERVLPDLSAHLTAVPVVTARRLSAGARTLLNQHGLSWADETGDALIAVGTLLVTSERRTQAPVRGAVAPRLTETSGAIAEYLLWRCQALDTRAVPPLAAICEAIPVSRGRVSHALQVFDDLGWTTKVGPARGPGAARVLIDPGQMLSAWAGWHADGRLEETDTHAFIRDGDDWIRTVLAPRWPTDAWALTGVLALDLRGGSTTSVNPIELYLDQRLYDGAGRLDELLALVDLERVDTGPRVRILRADRHALSLVGIARNERDAYPQVSDIRLYGDLVRRQSHSVRGAEVAEEFRRTRVRF